MFSKTEISLFVATILVPVIVALGFMLTKFSF